MASTPYVTTAVAKSNLGGSTDTVSFYNGTGSTRRASAAQAVPATGTISNSSPYGFQTKAYGDNLIATVAEIVATLTATGLWKGGA